MKVKIHYPSQLLSLGRPVDLLVPFVGISNSEFCPGRLLANTFSDYSINAADYFIFTSIEECDVALLPIFYDTNNNNASSKNLIKLFLDLAQAKNKKVFIFLDSFSESHDIYWENAIIFSRAVSKSRQQKNVYSYPLFFEDYIKYNKENKLLFRDKYSKPVIGFCGYSPPLGIKFGKAKIIGLLKLAANYAGIMKIFPNRSSHSTRARVLWQLLRCGKVATNFRIKQLFAFGPQGQLNTGNTKESDDEFRTNFVNNIIESDYTLCVRGIRNTSIRFFETLCCGRIPLFINTDCVLPFDFLVDWNTLMPWVDDIRLNSTHDILSKFHEDISEQEFIDRQQKMRNLWKEYLSADGFFKNMALFLEHQKEINTTVEF